MSEDKQDKEAMAAWADALKDEVDQKAARSFSDDKLGSLQNDGSSAGSGDSSARLGDISMVLDIPVQLTVELGRTCVLSSGGKAILCKQVMACGVTPRMS